MGPKACFVDGRNRHQGVPRLPLGYFVTANKTLRDSLMLSH